jgi:hypothetical protein
MRERQETVRELGKRGLPRGPVSVGVNAGVRLGRAVDDERGQRTHAHQRAHAHFGISILQPQLDLVVSTDAVRPAT